MNSKPVPSAGRKPWIGAAALALPALLATLNLVTSLDTAALAGAALNDNGGLLWIANAAALLLQETWPQAFDWLARRVCGSPMPRIGPEP